MTNEAEFIKDLISSKTREKAFNKLLNLYQERLYWHIRKIVITHDNANDVLQNTFIRIYKSLSNFKQKSSLHTWMFRIAYNESIRFLEQNKKKQNLSIDDLDNNYYMNSLVEDSYFEGNEIQLRLQKLLSKIPENQRYIFQMKYYDELKFNEMSKILGIKESTLKSSYYTTVKYIENNISNIELLVKNEI